MSLTITFLGHAGFVLDDGTHQLAIDPFLTGNPLAVNTPDEIKAKHIALTHGHEDHFGDTLTIAKANDATVYAAYEICMYCNSQGHSNISPGNPGGQIETPFGYIAFTQAFHSSSYKGQYMGLPCGLIINMGGVTFYHCGDTGIFSDMKLIGEIYKPDIAAIPVGDRFTMGPKLGTLAAEMIQPKTAIPIHYKTFEGMITDDISEFQPKGITIKAMEPGEIWGV